MNRVKNLKSMRSGDNVKLIGDIAEIKTLLQQEKIPDQDFSKITEIGVILPKENVKITSKITELSQEIELMEKFDKDLNKNMFEGINEKEIETG